jgi:hypothetical protein
MRILFLYGWNSKPSGVKPTYLAEQGHEVINPALHDEDFAEAVRVAEVGGDHRLADPEPLAAMLRACLAARPRVVGCDFGVPKKAGDQAKKIILVEAVRLGQRHYAVEPTGRNARLVRDIASRGPWKERRRGWTLPDLADSLSSDPTVKVVAFDFRKRCGSSGCRSTRSGGLRRPRECRSGATTASYSLTAGTRRPSSRPCCPAGSNPSSCRPPRVTPWACRPMPSAWPMSCSPA